MSSYKIYLSQLIEKLQKEYLKQSHSFQKIYVLALKGCFCFTHGETFEEAIMVPGKQLMVSSKH